MRLEKQIGLPAHVFDFHFVQLEELVDQMSALVEKDPKSTTTMQHTARRHEEILSDYQRDFRRTQVSTTVFPPLISSFVFVDITTGSRATLESPRQRARRDFCFQSFDIFFFGRHRQVTIGTRAYRFKSSYGG